MTKGEKITKTWALKREYEAQRKAEREANMKALREVRDDPNASPADRLRAVELLSSM